MDLLHRITSGVEVPGNGSTDGNCVATCCYILYFGMCFLQVSEEECSLICEGRHEDQLLKSYLLSEIKTSHENSSTGSGSAKHRKGS